MLTAMFSLDFTCHIGAAPLGYNNEKVLSKVREFDLVEPMKIAGRDMYFGSGPSPDEADFPGSSHLMQKLTEVSSQYGMDTVFSRTPARRPWRTR